MLRAFLLQRLGASDRLSRNGGDGEEVTRDATEDNCPCLNAEAIRAFYDARGFVSSNHRQKGPSMNGMDKRDERFHILVKHRYTDPPRYTWEIHNVEKVLAVKESESRFDSWEEASRAGNIALEQFLGR